MFFSLVIPFWRVEAYLPALFSSLEAQDFRDFEVLFIDDDSPDGSTALVKAACQAQVLRQAEGDPACYRYLWTENHGVGPARNLGLQEARGDYVFFVDSDDSLEPWALSTLATALRQTPEAEALFFGFVTQDVTGRTLDAHPAPLPYGELRDERRALFLQTAAPWGHVVQRRFYLAHPEIQFPAELWYEDLACYLRLVLAGPRWLAITALPYRYRLRPASTMQAGVHPRSGEIFQILALIEADFATYMDGLDPNDSCAREEARQGCEAVLAYHGYLATLSRLLKAGATAADLAPYQAFRQAHCPHYRHNPLLSRKQKLLGLLYDLRLYPLLRLYLK